MSSKTHGVTSDNNTRILNTCIRLRITESEQATPVDSIKDVVRSSVKVPEFDKHLKKAGGHCGNNNKDEDNSLKTLNDEKLTLTSILLLKQ